MRRGGKVRRQRGGRGRIRRQMGSGKGNGTNNGDGHFHTFQNPAQSHLQTHDYPSTDLTVTAPRRYKHTHQNEIFQETTHRHNFSPPVVKHWTNHPGVGPQGGYAVQESAWGTGYHGYRHIHPGTGGEQPTPRVGTSRRRSQQGGAPGRGRRQMGGGKGGGRVRRQQGGLGSNLPTPWGNE
tara:strand:- start:38 stop:580 length:543 start_codon:yes stop_codon:yes gene_type:complete